MIDTLQMTSFMLAIAGAATGDSENILVPITLMAMAIALGALSLVLPKKRRKHGNYKY